MLPKGFILPLSSSFLASAAELSFNSPNIWPRCPLSSCFILSFFESFRPEAWPAFALLSFALFSASSRAVLATIRSAMIFVISSNLLKSAVASALHFTHFYAFYIGGMQATCYACEHDGVRKRKHVSVHAEVSTARAPVASRVAIKFRKHSRLGGLGCPGLQQIQGLRCCAFRRARSSLVRQKFPVPLAQNLTALAFRTEWAET